MIPIIALAIALSGATPHEARLLFSLARHESHFAQDVATCARKGDAGRALGAWQIHPRAQEEYAAACSLFAAAPLALARVRESLEACAHLPENERLAVYTSGSCSNRGGRAASRVRWVE